VSFEVVSEREYRYKYQNPVVIGGVSGITIGIGYDIGFHTAQAVTDDWEPYVIKSDLERLKKVVGLTRDAAVKAVGGVQDIFIPYAAAITVFKLTTLPRSIKALESAMPGAENLPPDCFGALVSLVLNRGTNMSGDRYKEMHAIKGHIASGAFEKIPSEIRSMKRLWEGQPDLEFLLGRRDMEASLCERSLAHGRKDG
jgi:hypothetical protein